MSKKHFIQDKHKWISLIQHILFQKCDRYSLKLSKFEKKLCKISNCDSYLVKRSRWDKHMFKNSTCDSNLFKLNNYEKNLFKIGKYDIYICSSLANVISNCSNFRFLRRVIDICSKISNVRNICSNFSNVIDI